jgi:uncharacterized repeat protein (TIGR03803 family)
MAFLLATAALRSAAQDLDSLPLVDLGGQEIDGEPADENPATLPNAPGVPGPADENGVVNDFYMPVTGGIIHFIRTPDGQDFTNTMIHVASATNEPITSLLLHNGVLSGFTATGGANGTGVFFNINVDGTGEIHADNPANQVPQGSIATAPGTSSPVFAAYNSLDGSLYGVEITTLNTPTGILVVASFSLTDEDCAGLKDLLEALASPPPGSQLKPAGVRSDGSQNSSNTLSGILFGVSETGGSNSLGAVFEVGTNGSNYKVLHDFAGWTQGDGQYPYGGLALSGSTLYGTTYNGGSNILGTIFKIDTDGSNYTVLHHFSPNGLDFSRTPLISTNNDGYYPFAGLVISGHTLFGTAYQGGANGSGTVFSMDTSGSNFTVLHNFALLTSTNASGTLTNADGANPATPLTLLGNALVGNTSAGGPYGYGTIFELVLPFLNITHTGAQVAVSWSSSLTNYVLQTNATLNSLTWSNFNGNYGNDGTNNTITVTPRGSPAFFRLFNPNGS